MKRFMGYMLVVMGYVLMVLLNATSANAFNFNFSGTKVIEVSPEVSPRIPLWQSATVEQGDIFSQYCADYLSATGLFRHYSLFECTLNIKAVNGYTDAQIHWIYPGQIVWLPSPKNVRLGQTVADEHFVNVEQLRILLGIDELEAKIDALPDETRLGEMVLDATQGVIEDILPGIVAGEVERRFDGKVSEATQAAIDTMLPGVVTYEVGRQLAEIKLTTLAGPEGRKSVLRWIFWLAILLIACLALIGSLYNLLRPTIDSIARQSADEAKAIANEAKKTAGNAATKAELEEVSNNFSNKIQAVDKRVGTVETIADEAGELAASAMALLRFGDFIVKHGFPSQTAIEKLKPNEELLVTLAHVDDEQDVRVIRFTCIADAFDDGRDGLKIDGITGQRRPIVKRRSNVATALANGAKANHLKGIEEIEVATNKQPLKPG